jgi:hypothetical protein
MKLDKNTIFSLLIVFLFIGSIFAMIAYSDNTEPTNPTPPENNDNLDLVNYTAQFDANVNELFPQILIAGKPLDFEESTINEKLLDVSGIKSKQLEFRPDQDGNITLILTLNVILEKKEEIIEQIKTLDIFEQTEVYQFGLLNIPEHLTFTNDQNQEIEYTFVKTYMEGILGIETQKEDNLSVVAYATFRGTELINSRAIEQVNNSNQFQMLVDFKNFEILGFKDTIYTQIEVNLNEEYDVEDIKNQITEIYENTTFETQVINELKLNTKDLNVSEKLELLKEEGLFLNYISDENATNISFDNNIISNYLETKEKILTELELTEDFILEELKININVTFEYEEIDTEEINQITNKTLEYQILAEVDTTDLTLSGKTYTYSEETTEVLLDYPEDLNKTEIELNVQGYYQRDNLLYLGLSK